MRPVIYVTACILSISAFADPAIPEAICSGPNLSESHALQFFRPGTEKVNLGRFTYIVRKRHCTSTNGCSPWKDAVNFLLYHYSAPEEVSTGTIELRDQWQPSFDELQGGTLDLRREEKGVSVNFLSDAQSHYYRTSRGIQWESRNWFWHGTKSLRDFRPETSRLDISLDPDAWVSEVHFEGEQGTLQVTESCASFLSNVVSSGSSNQWDEFQFAAIAHY